MSALIRSSEASRGIWASLVVGLALVYVETLLEKGVGVSTDGLYLYQDLMFGSVVGFFADKYFATEAGYKLLRASRSVWNYKNFKRSAIDAFGSVEFSRYIVTIFLDALISVPLFVYALRALPPGVTDTVVARRGIKILVGLITFFLFNNQLRFEWAYKKKPTKNMDMLVVVFGVCASMTFLAMPPVTKPNAPGSSTMNPRSKVVFVAIGLLFLTFYQLIAQAPDSLTKRVEQFLPSHVRSTIAILTIVVTVAIGLRQSRTRRGDDKNEPSRPSMTLVDHAVGVGLIGIAAVNVFWFVRV